MLRNIIIGVIIGYIVSYFGYHMDIINFFQPYVTFEITNLMYYIFCAVVACIFLKN